MEIKVTTKQRDYNIILEKGSLHNLSAYTDTTRRAFIISDDGVPSDYVQAVSSQFKDHVIKIVKQGEGSKSLETYQSCLKKMLEKHFTRKDVVIAVGGGVVGDLSGFVASSYMRGINFINIPTTTLSQIDSSIGGKTGVNLEGTKNIVGAFWQPSLVIIDTNVLKTLPERHYHNGLVEAIKASILDDESLFKIFEEDDVHEHIDEIIYKSLVFKKKIVEQDETETGIRKILNFGHSIGHGYESYYHLKDYYHGECVALGMMAIITNKSLKERLLKVLKKLNIPSKCDADYQEVYKYIVNDKKASDHHITLVRVDKIGKPKLVDTDMDEVLKICKEAQENE